MKRRLSIIMVVFICGLFLSLSASAVMAQENAAGNNTLSQSDQELKNIIYVNATENQQSMTKAEYCRILVNLYQYLQPKVSGENPTSIAIPTSSPYKDSKDPAILQAYALGITPPAPDGLFHPQDKLTFQDQAVMLYNCLKLIDPSIVNEAANSNDPGIYVVSKQAAPGTVEAISYLSSQAIIQPGQEKVLKPAQFISRADASQITLAAAQNLLAIKKFYLYGYQVINSSYASPEGASGYRILDENKMQETLNDGTIGIE